MTMNKSVTVLNPLAVGSFHTALLHQFEIIIAVALVLALAWNLHLSGHSRRVRAGDTGVGAVAGLAPGAARVTTRQGRWRSSRRVGTGRRRWLRSGAAPQAGRQRGRPRRRSK